MRLLIAVMLIASAARADDLRVDYVRESLTGTYTRYQQFIDGIRVIGGERIQTPFGTVNALAARGFSHVEVSVMTAHRGELVYFNVGGTARLAVREIVAESVRERYARYYDASTGALLRSDPLFFRVAARVFDVNPVVKLNDPTLQDHNNSATAVPDSAYSVVDLPEVTPAGPLAGPNVQIVDTDAPFTTRAFPSQSLIFDRSQPQFEEVNAYFQIDRNQRYLQSLGYVGPRRIVPYAIPVDAHAANGADNSFFAEGDVAGQGALFFGDGGTDDAEDADIVLHEFGHAIQTSIAPSAFDGSSASEARALAEGYSDYWAFTAKYAQALTSGRDPFCLADWDARCWTDTSDQKCGYPVGSDCLRRVDSTKTMTDYIAADLSGIEHENGEIWSSALREIRAAMTTRYGVDPARRIADTDVIESMFGAPSNATFSGQGRKLLAADNALNGSGNADVICRALTSRRILGIGECGTPPRGERTLFQSFTSTLHVDDIRKIDDVLVRVRTNGQAGRVTVVAPDGTSALLTNNPQTDATYGLDTVSVQPLSVFQGHPAPGDWKLVVEGAQLTSWSLLIRFAGDAAFTTRPTTSQLRKHIPAVAHVIGAASTPFLSDVRIYNRSNFTASLIAIFTPTGADGTTQFAAMRLTIDPQHVMVLEDVVQETMQTSGTGQLELAGDVDRVIVNSRTYTPAGGGASFGDTIPSFNTVDAGADQIAPLHNTTQFRSNAGIAEVAGGSGLVRIAYFTADGTPAGLSDLTIKPYGHAQIRVPVAGANLRAQVAVVGGDAVVIAYASIVDNLSGDAMTIPAMRLPAADETIAIPAIHAPGVAGTNWRTDLWKLEPSGRLVAAEDVGSSIGVLFLDTTGAILGSRTYTSSGHGTYGEYIPALHAPEPLPQQLVGVEQSPRLRTNVGLVNFSSDAANATVVVYDATGTEVARTTVTVAGRSLQQLALATIVSGTVSDGRVEVRGPVASYASVVDNSSQDPTYIVGQY